MDAKKIRELRLDVEMADEHFELGHGPYPVDRAAGAVVERAHYSASESWSSVMSGSGVTGDVAELGTAAHPFYTRLNSYHRAHDFDEYVEARVGKPVPQFEPDATSRWLTHSTPGDQLCPETSCDS